MNVSFVQKQFQEAEKVLQHFSTQKNFEIIENISQTMSQALKTQNKIISCGNGGSMCDAIHFAEELSGCFKNDRPAIAALSISDPGHISCVANDYGYDFIFKRFLEAVGKEGDIFLGISTSGNSKNVINAAKYAKKNKIKTVCLLGKDGGELKNIADIALIVEEQATERIQEVHIKIIHTLIALIEKNLGY